MDYTDIIKKLDNYVDMPRPKIVCLCGSTRYPKAFHEANRTETLKGNIVLSVGSMWHDEIKKNKLSESTKIELDQLHFRKIDLCDEILVLNLHGYVGESTSNEIAYAMFRNKPIRFAYPAVYHINNDEWGIEQLMTYPHIKFEEMFDDTSI